LFLVLVLPIDVFPQQRRQRPAPKNPATAEPITFDTLLGSDRYKIYIEARGVGQLIRSNSVNELLESVLKLVGPPQEFKEFIRWIDSHADDVMSSRMLCATWPSAKNVPDVVFALEFETPEEAAKFLPQLNSFLPKVLPPQPAASPSPADIKGTAKSNDTGPVKSTFFLKQTGSLILISSAPINLTTLRPTGNKLLSEQTSFRVARNRFTSEQVFLYFDVNSIVKEDEERRKQYEEEEKKQTEQKATEAIKSEPSPSPEEPPNELPQVEQKIDPPVEATPPIAAPTPDPLSTAVGTLVNAFFMSQAKWPDGIGVGVSFEHDSFDVRALLISAPGEKCDVMPLVPNLKLGPPLIPESPSILPADTELFATLSLDLPEILTAVNKPVLVSLGPHALAPADEPSMLPLFQLEKLLKINIKDELLPLLGSEVVISMPVKMLEDGPKRRTPVDTESTPSDEPASKPSEPSFVVALALRDREGMKALLPKIVDSLGFKGASALAQTERREDIELVSYGKMFSYAFIGNFLVLSVEPGATRHVVDSYLKHETLSSDAQFKNYTRWQPRQLQAQIYVSPALMESYKSWAEEPSALLSDQTKDFLLSLGAIPQPITYSLSNDGLGTLHELHVPKNLILMAVAGMSAESNPSPIIANERATIGALHMIASVEAQYRSGEGQGSYGSLEKLIENEMVSKQFIENNGYKIELTLTGNKFEVTATPLEYGKTGRLSYFIDDSNILRGADHGGATASAGDKPIP
jgi:hypothetical protein